MYAPDLVPRSLLVAARIDNILTRARALAAQHDASDLAFNADLRGKIESMAPVAAETIDPPPRTPTNGDLILAREKELIESLRSRFSTPLAIHEYVSQFNHLIPQQLEQERGFLDHLGGIVSSAREAFMVPVDILGGENPMSALRRADTAVDQIRNGTIDLGEYSLGKLLEGMLASGELAGDVADQAREHLLSDKTPLGIAAHVQGAMIEAFRERDPGRVFRMEPGDSAVFYAAASDALGRAFDGERFWHDVFVHGGAGIATGFGAWDDYGRAVEQAERNWENIWNDLPREAQLLIEEMNPGNVALIAAGGPLSRVLLASGTRGSTLLARMVEPMVANPLVALPTEVGLVVGGRSAWERTDNAPLALRIPAVAAGAAAGALSPRAVIRGARQVDTLLIRDAMRAAEGPLDQAGAGILRLTPDGVLEEGVNERFGASIADFSARLRDTPEEVVTNMRTGHLDHEVTRHNDGSVTVRLVDPDDPAEHTFQTQEGAARYLADAEQWEPQGIEAQQVPAETIDPFGISPVEPGDENLISAVGYSDARGIPLPLKAALGDGGRLRVPHTDEILDPLAAEVRDNLNQSDVTLSARLGPVPVTRERVPVGNRSTPIPNVAPFSYPPQTMGLRAPSIPAGQRPPTVAGVVDSTIDRARDVGRRKERDVPQGIADNLMRSEANYNMREGGLFFNIISRFNQAVKSPAIRKAIYAGVRAGNQIGWRVAPSRRQFIGGVKEIFGDTTRLPSDVEFRNPAMFRSLAVKLSNGNVVVRQVPASQHPLTGTIVDLLENPHFYDDPRGLYQRARTLFLDYDVRNEEFHTMLGTEYGVDIKMFDTGLDPNTGGRGIYIPIREEGGDIGSAFTMRSSGTITERLASIDPDSPPIEPILDIEVLFSRLDAEKIAVARRETMRWGLGGHDAPINDWSPVHALDRPQRIVSPTDPNTLIDRKIPYYLPPEEAEELSKFLSSRGWGGFEAMENLKNVTLNMDASPLTIMGAVGWAVNAFDQSLNIIRAFGTAARQGDPLRPFRNETVFRDIAAAPQEWVNFLTDLGHPPVGSTPEEWRNEWMRMVPGLGRVVGGLNDAIGNMLLKGAFSDYTEYARMMAQRGFDEYTARATAADMVKMSWLRQNFDELGTPTARRMAERGLFISAGFIRQPVNFMAHAAMGYLQLGTKGVGAMAMGRSPWQAVGPREQLAAQMFTKMAGTMAGIAAISSMYTAHERGLTPEEAVMETLFDFDSPNWMSVQIPDAVPGSVDRLPIGGPFRGLVRAIMPQNLVVGGTDLTGFPVPFGGLPTFFQNRLTTSIQTVGELAMNEDFFGEPIIGPDPETGESQWWGFRIAQALEYAALNTVPLMIGGPLQSFRAGASVGEALQEMGWEFLGQSPAEASEYQNLEQEFRLAARQMSGESPEQWAAYGMTPEQIAAAQGFTSYGDLQERIGTRAARMVLENVSPEVGEAHAEYVTRLRRRTAIGDRTAQQVLLRVGVDEKLTVAADQARDPVTGGMDWELFRSLRRQIMSEYAGARAELDDGSFESRAEGEIDRLTEQVYALYDLATPTITMPDGREVPGETDFELREQLEEEFYANLPQDTAALVRANVEAFSMSAPPEEREYIAGTRRLAESGFYDIGEEVWRELQGLDPETVATAFGLSAWVRPGDRDRIDSAKLTPEALEELGFNDAIEQSRSSTEFRANMLPVLAQALYQSDNGQRPPEIYLIRAKEVLNNWNSSNVSGWLNEARIRWASENIESGVAHLALERGELTEMQYATALGRAQQAGLDIESLPSEWWAQPSSPVSPARQSDPQSALPFNEQLLSEFVGGSSYEQIGIRYGLSGDAVRQRIKRLTGTTPSSLRA